MAPRCVCERARAQTRSLTLEPRFLPLYLKHIQMHAGAFTQTPRPTSNKAQTWKKNIETAPHKWAIPRAKARRVPAPPSHIDVACMQTLTQRLW